MSKFFVALTLIANLLLCPFRCMSSEWHAAVAEGAAGSVCPCCQRGDSHDRSPVEENEPENDCSCPNCICQGATLQEGPKLPAGEVPFASRHSSIPAEVAAEFEAGSCPACMADRVWRCAGGRSARIAFQSWLI